MDPRPSAGLTSHLPRFQRRRLAKRGRPQEPTEEPFQGAVLFVDVAGFTALTDQYAARGPRGAEELSTLIDACFGSLTRRILEHGGDVLAYAGDAVLALWRSGDDLPAAVQRATGCALALQTTTARDAAGDGSQLPVRSSIACGDLRTLELGGLHGAWQLLTVGQPINEVGFANDLAEPGQIVMTPTAWSLVASAAQGVPLARGHVRLTEFKSSLPVGSASDWQTAEMAPEAIADEDVSAFVNRVVAGRQAAGQSDWLAEFRNVSIAFAQVVFDEECDADRDALQAALAAAQEAVSQFDGEIYQTLMDDKGIVLIAAFGLPLSSHEDDAARAVQYAVRLQGRLLGQGIGSSVGVTTGRVYSGVYGSEARQQYTMVGPAINLAARLMQQAGSGMLCDALTSQLAQKRSDLEFEIRQPLTLKGKSEPVAVFEPVAARQLRRRSLVGRQEERAQLESAVTSLAESGSTGVLVIEGDAGIGKSRLLETLSEHCREVGVAVLTGRCLELESHSSFFVWRGLLRQLLRLDERSDADVVAARVLRAVDQDAAELAPLLNVLFSTNLAENATTEKMSAAVRGENAIGLLLRSLGASLGDKPTVVILEDVHWMDPSSWTFAARFAQEQPGVLLVLSRRPTSEHNESDRVLRSLPRTTVLPLQPLSFDASHRMVAHALDVDEVPQDVSEAIRQKAEGNPFYIEELSYALRDTGVLRLSGRRCEVVPRPSGATIASHALFDELPATVQGVVTSRIDRLTPEQQLALKVASVLGFQFQLDALRAILPRGEAVPVLDEVLPELERQSLIQATGEDGFRFRHAITLDVAYGALPFAQRRQFHRAVAEWVEEKEAPQLQRALPLLAHHWTQAEDHPKALRYLSAAGTQALRQFANREAIRFLQQALDLVEGRSASGTDVASTDLQVSQHDQANWQLQLGQAYVRHSQYEEGIHCIEQGLRIHGEPVPGGRGQGAWALLTQALRQWKHRLWPNRYVASGSSKQVANPDIVPAYDALVEAYFLNDAPLQSLHAAVRSLNLAEAHGLESAKARGYATLGSILGYSPAKKVARHYADRARETAVAEGDAAAGAFVAMANAFTESNAGNWERSRQLAEQAKDLAQQAGERRTHDDALLTLGMLAYVTGDVPAAVQHAAGLYDSSKKRGDARGQAQGLRHRARSALLLGSLEEAEECLREMQTFRWNIDARFETLCVSALQAEVAFRRHHPLEALQAAVRSLDVMEQAQTQVDFLAEYTWVADIVLGQQEGEGADREARDRAQQGTQRVRKVLGRLARMAPCTRPYSLWMRGREHRLRSQSNKAASVLRDALDIATASGMLHVAKLLHRELGHLEALPETERREHRDKAGALADAARRGSAVHSTEERA